MEIKSIKTDWKMMLSLLTLIVGILIYLGWGLTYNVWTDIGIYSITIVFVALGALGLLSLRVK